MRNRLFYIILPLLYAVCLHGQGHLVEQGDEAMRGGYYKTAFDYYLLASVSQPGSASLLYKLAEASRMSNDYESAADYYRQVLESRQAHSFPDAHYHMAQMYKCCGWPDSALRHFEAYLATFPADAGMAERARQEVAACEWILQGKDQGNTRYWVRQESRDINTAASESGAVRMGKDKLLFSAIREASVANSALGGGLALMRVYQADLSKTGEPGTPYLNEWGLNSRKEHSGNVAVDSAHQTLFFTRCAADDFANPMCAIYYMRWDGRRWRKPQPLQGDVNVEGYSSTQPTVGRLPNGNAILYFSSNRPNGMGGFDIWYTVLDSAMRPSPCVNLGYPVNTKGDEITPFYSNAEGRLYFSSDWHYGFGAHDVFFAQGAQDAWSVPVNLGTSLNSPANDIYFTHNGGDPHHGYLTSNRAGSAFVSGNTCCNDIYRWQSETVEEERPLPPPTTREQRDLARQLLPLALYFDNDRPDPKSRATTTSLTYFQTYNAYMFRRKDYKAAQRAGSADSAGRAIDAFFDGDVQGGCERFERFMGLLSKDLSKGRRVRLTIEGYASPLHSSEYNVSLSKRRISSIVNQLMAYNGGEMLRYLGGPNGGSLQLREVAHGSSRAPAAVSASREDTASSVFSLAAAKERRIEIQDYQYLEDDSSLITCLRLPSRTLHVGTHAAGRVADIVLSIPHAAAQPRRLAHISVGIPEVTVRGYSPLSPGEDLAIYLRLDATHLSPVPSALIPITLRVEGEGVTHTLFLEYGLK